MRQIPFLKEDAIHVLNILEKDVRESEEAEDLGRVVDGLDSFHLANRIRSAFRTKKLKLSDYPRCAELERRSKGGYFS